jgi:hypothetical protein
LKCKRVDCRTCDADFKQGCILQAEEFVADGTTFLTRGEKRKVRILAVDLQQSRISISLLEPNVKSSNPRRPQDPSAGSQDNSRRLRSDRPAGGRGRDDGGRGMSGGRGRGMRGEGGVASSRSQGWCSPVRLPLSIDQDSNDVQSYFGEEMPHCLPLGQKSKHHSANMLLCRSQ